MQKNDLIRNGNKIIRILDMADGLILIVDCLRQSVPKWISKSEISEYTESSMEELSTITGIFPISLNTLDSESTRYTHARFTMIAGVLPFINDNTERCTQTEKMAVHFGISKQTINHLLWMYLVYQDISVLAPKKICYQRPLTKDEKNMRWALNKYFYNTKKNSLQTAYTMMLKDKYCDTNGVLLPEYPTIHQFRYFYRKHRKMQNYYISRDGLKNYQRNHRPLTGNGIQAFAPNVGIGMLDSTVCDKHTLFHLIRQLP